MYDNKKVLLVNPNECSVYEKAKVKEVAPSPPPLNLAIIAGDLLKNGHDVKIFDFNLYKNDFKEFKILLQDYKPDYVGVTATTPLFDEACKILRLVKSVDKKIVTVIGGVHVTSFPKESLKPKEVDTIVLGEGDFIFSQIVNANNLRNVTGIGYKAKGRTVINPRKGLIKNLDDLPYPAWELYNLNDYKNMSKIIAKNVPVGWIETSRGCVFDCVYCNKCIFGRTFRTKSVERVIKEIEDMLNFGFKEIHIADDGFTTNMKRAKEICKEIIRKDLKFSWTPLTGTRVDKVDFELLKLMKKAGCYKIFYGIESGNQQVINGIKKGITLDQVRNAVKLARKADLEVWGAFMIGLPNETEETMKDTINFAKELDLNLAKLTITIPLPGTPLFHDFKKRGLLKSKEFSNFNFYNSPKNLYNHPNLEWDVIIRYYNKFYKEFYFRSKFIFRRILFGIKNGTLLNDFKVFIKTKW